MVCGVLSKRVACPWNVSIQDYTKSSKTQWLSLIDNKLIKKSGNYGNVSISALWRLVELHQQKQLLCVVSYSVAKTAGIRVIKVLVNVSPYSRNQAFILLNLRTGPDCLQNTCKFVNQEHKLKFKCKFKFHKRSNWTKKYSNIYKQFTCKLNLKGSKYLI